MNGHVLKFIFLVLTSALLITLYVLYSNSDSAYERILELHHAFKERIFLDNHNQSDPFFDIILPETTPFNAFTIKKSTRIFPYSPRIFCIILTSKNSLNLRGTAVYESWATKCDKFKFVTKIPDYFKTNLTNSRNVIKLDDLLDPPGLKHDSYDKLTDKMFYTLKYLYEQQRVDPYDFYLKADDDSFIFVDNLREFLRNENSSEPATFGYDFKVIVPKGYHSGGGSYVLTNEALKRIGGLLSSNFSACVNTGTEDVEVALCLRSVNVYPKKSLDALGRERFHPFDIRTHYTGEYPDWFLSYASNPIQKGLNCCSDSSVSFHYMSADDMHKTSSFLFDLETSRSQFKFEDLIRYLSY